MRKSQLIWILSIVLLVTAGAVPMGSLEDGDDDREDNNTEVDAEETHSTPRINTYLLYTRRNPESYQTLVMNDHDSVWNSNFNGRVPTVVVVHGWLSTQDIAINPTIRDAYLQKSDVNVIICEWRTLALQTYAVASSGMRAAGRELGEFIAYLNRVGAAQFGDVHLIGFGLGAHLVGNAGRHLGRRAGRITGLDPAGPQWLNHPDRLRETDAIYVEAIHTNGAYLGYGIGSAIARADFFPNGGNSQPGCISHHCSHNRAWELFASTVTNDHLVGSRCTNNLQLVLNKCRGWKLNMGNDRLDKYGIGMYRLTTGRIYPF